MTGIEINAYWNFMRDIMIDIKELLVSIEVLGTNMFILLTSVLIFGILIKVIKTVYGLTSNVEGDKK